MNKVIKTIGGMTLLAGVGSAVCFFYRDRKKWKRESQKTGTYYYHAREWLLNKQHGRDISCFFTQNGIDSIAIYGMRGLGETLYNDLKDSNVRIKCFIDNNAPNLICPYADVEVYSPEETIEDVDAIVVTPIYEYNAIRDNLVSAGHTQPRIISLHDVIMRA